MGILLILFVIGWMVWDWIRDTQAAHREAARRVQKVALRRRYLSTAPDSPAAYEQLGDAMREADDPTEAIACYEEAIQLAQASPNGPAGSGWIAGAGLENKLRLARLELAEAVSPAQYGQTMETRQQVCRTCGHLGMPDDTVCRICNAPLPVASMLDTLRNKAMRQGIIGETAMFCLMFGIIILAVCITNSLPVMLRGAIFIVALLVIPLRLLKKWGDG